MTAPIKGTSGTVKIDTSTNQKSITWVGSWEVSVENSVETIGPHIGDANEYEVATAQKYTFKLSGTIPDGTDDGQEALFAAVTARTNIALELATIKGKKFTFADGTTTYKKLTIKTDAKGTHTFEAEGSGPAILADGPAS